jgi:hypothetical protein
VVKEGTPAGLYALTLFVGLGVVAADALCLRDFVDGPTLVEARRARAEMAAWPGVPGRITELRVVTHRDGHFDYFTAGASYKYSVDGKEFEGKKLARDWSVYGSNDMKDFRRKMALLAPGLEIKRPPTHETFTYPVDQAATIHYDPKNPAESIVNNVDGPPPAWFTDVLAPLWFGFFFALLGAGGVAFGMLGLFHGSADAEKSPSARVKGDGPAVLSYDDGLPWLWLVCPVGELLLGCGGMILWQVLHPQPGEEGFFLNAFAFMVGAFMSLSGLAIAIIPFREFVLIRLDQRVVTKTCRWALLPLIVYDRKTRPLSDFARIRSKAHFDKKGELVSVGLSLARDGSKEELHICDGDQESVLPLAAELAQATGLPYEASLERPQASSSRGS